MSTTSLPPSPSLFRHLILDNPMTLEATRVWRRFIRSGGDTGKGVNVTAMVFVAVMYTWCLFAILRFHEDMSTLLLLLEAALLTLVVPGSMYAAVSGERERLTWDGLIMTSLSPGQIVVGKLLWRVVLILGIAALFTPPLLLCQFAVGVLNSPDGASARHEYTLSELFLAQGIVVSWGLLLAGFSLWVSTKTRRAVTTLAIITITLLSFLFLVPMLVGLFGGRSYWSAYDPPLRQLGALLLHLHPYDSIWYLSKEGAASVGYGGDQWVKNDMVRLIPWIYLGGAIACIVGAWKTLRGLEEPRVRS
ncbi:MAG: hypothetical protein V4671_30615 [Armatimonadota bacterium]